MSPNIYLVGGAVRDLVLGNEPKDYDYLVVGANPEWMLAQGFKQVGTAFPVFLHPETGDEYALARKEKKTAPGYHGFEFEFGPHITLEDDLIRRDLTINAMVMINGNVVDPFGGLEDLKNKIIRHTSIAFVEDPLRVLRTARFAARYNFSVHPTTFELCKQLVSQGELDALSPERVWIELEKLMSEAEPSVGIKFLYDIKAHKSKALASLIAPPIDFKEIYNENVEQSLNFEEKCYLELNVYSLSKTEINDLRIPTSLARITKFYDAIHGSIMLSKFHYNFIDVDEIVSVFDTFREEIRNGMIDKVSDLVKKLMSEISNVTEETSKFLDFLNNLKQIFEELLALNFTELTKNKKPSEIKQIVANTKREIVKKRLKGDHLG